MRPALPAPFALTITLAASLALHAPAGGAEPPARVARAAPAAATLDLLEAWQLGLQRDPTYAASTAGRVADQEAVPQARAKLLPNVRATAGGQAIDHRRASSLGEADRRSRALWSLTLSQPLFDLAAWSELKRAGFQAAAADVTETQAYQDLALRVAQAYFDVLAAQDSLRVLEAQRAAIGTQLQAAQRSFELGSATITDRHESQARMDLVQANLVATQSTLQRSLDQLAAVTGERNRPLAPLSPQAVLPPPDPLRLDDWILQAMQANLGVLRADLQTRITEQQLSIARSGHYPTLRLEAQTGSASDSAWRVNEGGARPRALDTTVGLQLSIPLYAGGGISSTVREQTSRLQQARHRLEEARRLADVTVRQHFTGVTNGLSRVSALQAAERSSEAALQANQTGYEIGVRTNIDVLNAQQQLFETRRALAQARYDTLMHSLRLKAGSGALTTEDITAVNQLLTAPR